MQSGWHPGVFESLLESFGGISGHYVTHGGWRISSCWPHDDQSEPQDRCSQNICLTVERFDFAVLQTLGQRWQHHVRSLVAIGQVTRDNAARTWCHGCWWSDVLVVARALYWRSWQQVATKSWSEAFSHTGRPCSWPKTYGKLTREAGCPERLIKGGPAKELMTRPGTLLVMDDLQADIVTGCLTRKLHHNDTSIAYLVQSVFDKTLHHRTISLNATYNVRFKNPWDASQVKHLSSKYFPWLPSD